MVGKRLKKFLRVLGSASICAFAPSAQAAPVNAALQQDYLTPYVGIFNLGDSDNAVQFGLEYRFPEWVYWLRPTLGFNIDTDGGAYGYAGLNWELPLLQDKLFLIPNFMAGAYHEGDSKDLGGALEFRSGLELAYQLPNQHRLGIAYNHISNASIYDKNPGAETLLLNYSVPIAAIGSW